MAFPRATQQAFFEGFVAAFRHFGGVFRIVRLDNLKSAVRKILRGRRRDETDNFVALRSHYLFETEFCRPGKEGAAEKGGVEGGVGRFRRAHLVPVPHVESFDRLNAYLVDRCGEDDNRRMEDRARSIKDMWLDEKPKLRLLPSEEFPTATVKSVRVDSKSRVLTHTNRYSVPVKLAHRKVELRVHANMIEVYHGGKCLAKHERLHGRHQQRLELDHYLDLLQHKSLALGRCLALHQARDAGRWPAPYDAFWKKLQRRDGTRRASEQMVELLLLHREIHPEEVAMATELAVACGCINVDYVRILHRQLTTSDVTPRPMTDLGALERYENTADTDLSAYDLIPKALELVS